MATAENRAGRPLRLDRAIVSHHRSVRRRRTIAAHELARKRMVGEVGLEPNIVDSTHLFPFRYHNRYPCGSARNTTLAGEFLALSACKFKPVHVIMIRLARRAVGPSPIKLPPRFRALACRPIRTLREAIPPTAISGQGASSPPTACASQGGAAVCSHGNNYPQNRNQRFDFGTRACLPHHEDRKGGGLQWYW